MPTSKAPFRFFALPPELRNRVYEELLIIRQRNKNTEEISRHSQILRANKTCYAEGQPILQRLNAVKIRVAAYSLVGALPDEDTLSVIQITFADGIVRNLWGAFAHLLISAGTCYDVRKRWQHALQSGGGGGSKLSVSLELGYNTMTYDAVHEVYNSLLELQHQGASLDDLYSVALDALEILTPRTSIVPAGDMLIAELFQLAFAFEHFASTPTGQPLHFVGANGGLYDRNMARNHAHELMTGLTKPDPSRISKIWTLMANLLPARVANFMTRTFLPRRACGWDFRQDLYLVERQLSHLKSLSHSQRSLNLPYSGPPVVWGLMPAVAKFMREELKRHAREGLNSAVTRF
jgi:hypothetical protein